METHLDLHVPDRILEDRKREGISGKNEAQKGCPRLEEEAVGDEKSGRPCLC